MNGNWLIPLIGGLIIGIAVSLMLYWNGRVTGISGILRGTLFYSKGDFGWRASFILGLFFGGLVLRFFYPESLAGQTVGNSGTVIIAGLLVGYGTVLANGCTSGHGVCGVSRFSTRSTVATAIFILAGIITIAILKRLEILT